VVGGGITGIVTARLLKDAGLRVGVLEMRSVGDGATGYTTAKLTVGHHLIYADIEKKHGEDVAGAYAASKQWAIEHLERVHVTARASQRTERCSKARRQSRSPSSRWTSPINAP
jgi:glycine/D-amino acid oxidase-like deaminating enzyme